MTEPVHINLGLCAVCGADAQFTDKDPGAYPVSYCSRHLPQHLRARAADGQLALVTDETKAQLLEQAKALDIEGRTTMGKEELAAAVAARHASEVNAEEVESGEMSDAPATEQLAPEITTHDHEVGDDGDRAAAQPEPIPVGEARKSARRSSKK